MKNLSLNQRLAAVAFVLAFVGLLFSFISPDGMKSVNQKPNYISVVSLADRVKNREDMQIVDLRAKELFEEFHIPTAQHIPLDSFFKKISIPKGTLIFYSGDDLFSRQLWTRLPDSLKGRSYIVYGGIHDWYERLLYPELPAKTSTQDSAIFRSVHDLSLFYGGQAEFVEGQDVLEYYRQDLTDVAWPKSHRENGLVRKGC
ncbi:MAG: rhodanese-like domain-containing protein [Cyclobacteriaceae bacterium]